jgi:hypothetical protein
MRANPNESAWGLGRAADARRSHAVVLVAAVFSCVVSFATIAWVMPAANQAYRESIAGVTIAKGANELTLIELGKVLDSERYESTEWCRHAPGAAWRWRIT